MRCIIRLSQGQNGNKTSESRGNVISRAGLQFEPPPTAQCEKKGCRHGTPPQGFGRERCRSAHDRGVLGSTLANAVSRSDRPSVARQAGCNRATFYYYFDSIEDLAEQAVDAAIPTGIADLAEKFLSESGTQFRLDENQRGAVERICLLTGPNGSTRLTERFKRALAETWASKFGLDLTQEDVHAGSLHGFGHRRPPRRTGRRAMR